MSEQKSKIENRLVSGRSCPEFRVSFPHVFEPHSGFEGQEEKYSVVMLFKKSTDISVLRKAAAAAVEEKWPDKDKRPKNLRSPFRDGDEKADLNGYADHWVVTASSKQRPGIVNQKCAPITAEDATFYAGCYARAELVAYAYDKAGNRGVSFALNNIQKLRDGEPFSGRRAAKDSFDDVDDGSDDPTSYGGQGGGDDIFG